jgi:hypothetical protein
MARARACPWPLGFEQFVGMTSFDQRQALRNDRMDFDRSSRPGPSWPRSLDAVLNWEHDAVQLVVPCWLDQAGCVRQAELVQALLADG